VLVFHKVAERLPGAEIDENTKIKPGAVSPDPDTWEGEGQEIWLEAHVDA
jgi:hypothetical protein